ncbi:MAG TPA: Ig-like domain-containing protein, partial [Iamia sp.]|nr:Ig-like domain-containing protein [Iamia sp.]
MVRKRSSRVVLVAVVVLAGLGLLAPASAAPVTAEQITLAATPTTAVWSQPVKLAVTIVPRGGGAPKGGTVTFLDGPTPIGTATATKRITTFTTSALTVGEHVISAEYSGDATTAAGRTQAVEVHVLPAATAITVTAQPATGPTGTLIEMRARVTPTSPASARAAMVGHVTFTNGTKKGIVGLRTNGTAVWRTTFPAGAHTISATYGGSE